MNVIRRKILTSDIKSHPVFVRLSHEGKPKPKPVDDIPGPVSLPRFGTMLHYLPVIGQYDFRQLPETYAKMHKQYGDIVREDCHPKRRIIHVYKPSDMYEVYRSDKEQPRRLSHTALGKYRLMRPHMYVQGLLPTNGDEWANFRNIFKRSLLLMDNVNLLLSHFEEVTDDLIKVIPNHLDENDETDLTPLLYRWGLETVGYATMNKRLGCLTKEGNPDAEGLIKAAEDTHLAVYETELKTTSYEKNYRLLERAQDFIGTVVERYMNSFLEDDDWPEKNCVLSRLLQCEGADKKKVFTMLIDMFLAGIESSSFTLSFALYNLAKNPDVQEKLRQDLKTILPTLEDRMADGNKSTRYLMATLNETLRVNPISIGNGRLLNEDVILSGYLIPKDTMVILQHQTSSMSKKYFDNPEKFMPERWIDNKARTVAYSPFGFGYRTCIGKHMAEKQIRIAIAKFVRNFEISYHHEPIGSKTVLLNLPDKPLRLRLRRITQ